MELREFSITGQFLQVVLRLECSNEANPSEASVLKIIVIAFTIGLGTCLAQADRAAVTGTITDQSHAAMSTARVAVVYPATALRRETQSSSTGAYEIAGLPIGECYLEVSAPGFQTVQTKPF